jgi:hypothetical protein
MPSRSDFQQTVNQQIQNLDPIQHLRNLNFPRRTGSDGDRKGTAYISQVLEQIGIEPVIQEFYFQKPKILPRLIIPLLLLLWTALSLVNLRFWNNNLVVSLVVLALPLTLILMILNFDMVMRYFFGRRRRKLQEVSSKIENKTLQKDQFITSRNVIAEIGAEEAEKHVLFTAHHDSVSSKLPMRVMMICAILGAVGLFAYSILYLINLLAETSLGLNFQFFATFATVVLVLLEIFFISRLFRGNESHGIIDDGTGVAILLELARFVKVHEIHGGRFTFGFFGAEESGLIGSAHYYLKHDIDKDKLHVISIDMIGERPPLSYVTGIYPIRRRQMDPTFNTEIASIAKRLEIEIKGKNFPYPGSDFGHFMLDGGCTTNWLSNGSRVIHSKRDNLSNVDETLVKDALKCLVAYLLELEKASG